MTRLPFTSLVEAALDQPQPTPALVAALNRVLAVISHPNRLVNEPSATETEP